MSGSRKLKDVRVTVTGGAGFIGSELVRQLCDLGAIVTVLDNFSSGKREYIGDLPVQIVTGDICDREIVSNVLQNQEIVIHAAALPFIPDCYLDPESFFRVNSMGTVNVLWQAVRSESVDKLVHISSSEVYGNAKYKPIDEDHPTMPHSSYAVSKLAADRAAFTFFKEHGFPVAIIRPFNSFGPRITQPYIIPEIIAQLMTGNTVKLGNVESERDFTYVTDTARGIVLSAVKDEAIGETINIGSGVSHKIRDIVRGVARIMGKDVRIEYDETRIRPYDVECLICENSKAQRLLGWKPEISFERGLKETISWMSEKQVQFKQPFRGWPRVLR